MSAVQYDMDSDPDPYILRSNSVGSNPDLNFFGNSVSFKRSKLFSLFSLFLFFFFFFFQWFNRPKFYYQENRPKLRAEKINWIQNKNQALFSWVSRVNSNVNGCGFPPLNSSLSDMGSASRTILAIITPKISFLIDMIGS